MKIKEITVGIHITKNLGNYNSIKLDHSVTVELDDDEDIEDVRTPIYEDIEAFLEERLKEESE